MDETGGCYCGTLRHHVTADPIFKAQCLCRECQYISGGGPNFFMIVPDGGFRYILGTPQEFIRTDLETPVTRQFCGICGTHIATRKTRLETAILKVGTLDNPSAYGGPKMAIFTVDQQHFHSHAGRPPTAERLPPR
jgi:hypothetical protein